ncbi:hypothetical protein JGUZn3_23150 [Entomobacter blattae]|uniref:Uncharacterized protein n=1 Tax=Entomobacter blattae TaxID=2762277 RepID=A0A7H1NUQ6_9PROT|nr:hypothetical protein JGUZn3_23150 [Entomobacter blattae]
MIQHAAVGCNPSNPYIIELEMNSSAEDNAPVVCVSKTT